jgi:cell division protease FtsH
MKKKNKKSMNKNFKTSTFLVMSLVFVCIFFLIWANGVNQDHAFHNYSKFLNLVNDNQIKKVEIQDQYLRGETKAGVLFESCIVGSNKFLETLHAKGIEVEVIPTVERLSWGSYFIVLLLFAFLIALIGFYFKQNQNNSSGPGRLFSFGKSKIRFSAANSVKTTFKDVAGIEEAKEDVRDIIMFLKDPDKFSRLGAKIPRGVLLSGAPGNGKTLLAKAVAGEASCPFLSLSGSDFVEVFVGVGASRVRDLFTQARKHSPCIVFIDEIDAVGRQRGVGFGGGNDEREQTLNQLLSEMDGFSTKHGEVIVLAATNRPDVLDSALMRPGRFDRIIEIPFPDLKSRFEILKIHSKQIKLDKGVDLENVAKGTPGFSGADLESLTNEAALIASKRLDESLVGLEDFEIAKDKILIGAERKTMIIPAKKKRKIAYHEAGHALLNVLVEDSDPFHKVTIIPRGGALGVSWSLPEGDKFGEEKTEMEAGIIICLGGLISEKLIFESQNSGASSDILKATKIARRMVCKYGMSELGSMVFGNNKDHPYLGRDMVDHSSDYSEKTAQKIDAEVEKIINKCYKKAELLLQNNIEKLKLLGETLLEKETLKAKEVYEIAQISPRKTSAFIDSDVTSKQAEINTNG